MRKPLLGGLVALLILPLQGQAALTEAQLEDLELNLWKIRTNFHMLTIMSGNQNYAANLDQSINATGQLVRDISFSAENGEEQELSAALTGKWQQLKRSAQANTVAAKGYTDAYTIRDINELPAAMSGLAESFEASGEGEYNDVRELAAYLQRMTSEYLNIAAAPAGGMASGTDEGRLEFKDAVPEFERMLARAKKNHADDDAMTRALNQVSVKWQFIRESMIKFYEDAVPFLIYRYTRQMTNTIEQAISLASTTVEKPTFGPPQ